MTPVYSDHARHAWWFN